MKCPNCKSELRLLLSDSKREKNTINYYRCKCGFTGQLRIPKPEKEQEAWDDKL